MSTQTYRPKALRVSTVLISGLAFLSLAIYSASQLAYPESVFADDGYLSYETRHTTIHYLNGSELQSFARGIGRGLVGLFKPSKSDSKEVASKRIESILDEVCKILDMPPPRRKITIRVHSTHDELVRHFSEFDDRRDVPIAFYAYESASVHVSLEDLSDKILAHELAHAVISDYFGKAATERVQEILAKYVDMHF